MPAKRPRCLIVFCPQLPGPGIGPQAKNPPRGPHRISPVLRICDLDESGLLARIFPLLPQGTTADVLLGPGDDCAILAAPDGRFVVTCDILIEGRHFRRDWSTGYDVGWRAAMQNLADVAAMGARPSSLVVGMGLPAQLDVAWLEDFARGLAQACDPLQVAVVGGDLSSADSLLVSVTAHGLLDGRAPLLRSGAQAGDILAHAGLMGHSAAGLALLAAGWASHADSQADAFHQADACQQARRDAAHDPAHACGQAHPPQLFHDSALEHTSQPTWESQEDLSGFIAAHLRPRPPLALGPLAAQAGAGAMMDVSDGLLMDAQRMARASGVCIDLSTEALRPAHHSLLPAGQALMPAGLALSPEALALVPKDTSKPARSPIPDQDQAPSPAAGQTRRTPSDLAWDWLLSGGEDHGLLATFPPQVPLPAGFTAIGRVLADGIGAPAAGGTGEANEATPASKAQDAQTPTINSQARVLVDGQVPQRRLGWDHFSPSPSAESSPSAGSSPSA